MPKDRRYVLYIWFLPFLCAVQEHWYVPEHFFRSVGSSAEPAGDTFGVRCHHFQIVEGTLPGLGQGFGEQLDDLDLDFGFPGQSLDQPIRL